MLYCQTLLLIMILSVYKRSNSYLLFLNCVFCCCGEACRQMCSIMYNIMPGPDECSDEMEWGVLSSALSSDGVSGDRCCSRRHN